MSLFLGCTLLAGCLQMLPDASSRYFGRDADSIVAYGNYVRSLSRKQLSREYADVVSEFRDSPDAYNRLRLSLLLLESGTEFTDVARARRLLQEYVEAGPVRRGGRPGEAVPGGEDSYLPMAQFLLGFIERHSELASELSRQRERSATAERKLHEIRMIEKSLNRY